MQKLIDTQQRDSVFYEELVKEFKGLPHEFVIAYHPATFMAARNYRSSLKKIGYHFPETYISDIYEYQIVYNDGTEFQQVVNSIDSLKSLHNLTTMLTEHMNNLSLH